MFESSYYPNVSTNALPSLAITTSLAALLLGLRVTYLAVVSPTSLKRTALVSGLTGASLGLLVIMWL
jgi:hypothetical protein